MKKRFLFLALAAVLLVACQTQETEEQPTEQDQNTEEEVVTEGQDATANTLRFFEPVELDALEIMNQYKDHFEESNTQMLGDESVEERIEYLAQYAEYWEVGEVTSGPQAGQKLLLVNQPCDGPCPPGYFRFLHDEQTDEWTLLKEYSQYNEPYNVVPYQISEKASLPQLDLEEEMVPFENAYAVLATKAVARKSEMTDLEKLKEGLYYSPNNGCVYKETPDGLLARYIVVPDLFKGGVNIQESLIKTELTLQAPSETIEREYAISAGRCGLFTSCVSQIEVSAEEKASMQNIGTVSGQTMLVPTNVPQTSDIADFEDYGSVVGQVQYAYNDYLTRSRYEDENQTPMTIKEYIEGYNLFFLELDSGLVLVRNANYLAGVECGKPVIYLYPEQETDVNVQVGIDEFTVTIPEYPEGGWNVTAYPNGEIVNHDDGQSYPYLFWEGLSDEEIQLEPGWSMAKEDIRLVLPKVLLDLGLNVKEAVDFMEFWYPHLMATPTPYVEFQFAPQSLFDQVAPLTVSPQPDKIIRVFMVWGPSAKAFGKVPDYNTPKRYGFTLVEWGGNLP